MKNQRIAARTQGDVCGCPRFRNLECPAQRPERVAPRGAGPQEVPSGWTGETIQAGPRSLLWSLRALGTR